MEVQGWLADPPPHPCMAGHTVLKIDGRIFMRTD